MTLKKSSRKGTKLDAAKVLVTALIAGILAGCTPAQKPATISGKTLLTVDFQQEQPLKYRFLSSRDITIDWGQMKGETGKSKVDKSMESLELIVSYTPVEVNQFGLTTIKAVCESAKVTSTVQSTRQQARPDAAESFAGKSWTITIDATGKMFDRSKIYDVIRQAGELAFRPDRSKGLVKEPDMIYDFIASQWFLWDSISSIKNPSQGVAVGDQWQSVISAPASMILFAARDVNYRLAEIRRDPNGTMAVIDSTYRLSYPSPSDWPVPYTEVFQMSGTFGFLRGYKLLDLEGQGQELFDVDAGRIEKDTQKYTMHVRASLPLGLGINPQVTIDQTLSTQLLEPTK
jgi:hypothetical protein